MSEWFVLKHGKMSALEVVDIKQAPPDFVFSDPSKTFCIRI